MTSKIPNHDFAAVRTRISVVCTPRVAIIGAILFLGMAAGWELFLRAKNAAAAPDPTALVQTAHQMRRMSESHKQTVAFVGSSRTFIGISPGTVRDELESPQTEVRLIALAGASARPLAELLYANVEFHGIVVIEVFPSVTYIDADTPSSAALQDYLARARWFDEAEHALFEAKASGRMFAEINSPMVVLRDWARRLADAIPAIAEGPDAPMSAAFAWHPDGWVELQPNKAFLQFAVQDMAHAAILVKRYGTAFDVRVWQEALDHWDDLDRRFAAKGVKMVFVRYPSAGDYLRAEEEYFPEHVYWNELVRRFPGRCWHFMDEPQFQHLNMPDGSHLVSQDALAFSRWMATKIKPLLK